MWLRAVGILALFWRRRQVKRLLVGVAGEPGLVFADVPALRSGFARSSRVGHWIRDVLILHEGCFFLNRPLCAGSRRRRPALGMWSLTWSHSSTARRRSPDILARVVGWFDG